MTRFLLYIANFFLVFFLAGASAFALGENILKFGGTEGWGRFKHREGITELEQLSPYRVLALNSVAPKYDTALDMALLFDESDKFTDSTGHYELQLPTTLYRAGASHARFGPGAAVFSGALSAAYRNQADNGTILMRARGSDALFSAGRNIGDFSIEFWLYPVSMGNGEEPFSWTSTVGENSYQVQNLSCVVSKNCLEWNFENFFFEPAVQSDTPPKSVNIKLNSSTHIVPKHWSHHLIRFDAATGLLEYLVNGVLEDIRYTTEGGSEGGAVFMPLVGERGIFALGRRFNGMVDNLYIYSRFVEQAETRRYSGDAWARSDTIDLGTQNSSVIRVDAKGGAYNAAYNASRDGIRSKPRGGIRGEPGARDPFNFPGSAQMQFFIRASDSKYSWSDKDWRTFIPGTEINTIKGRYIEIAVQFYPGGDFETTPYLEEINVIFVKQAPPEPPPALIAEAKDGSIKLSWKQSKDANAAGYLVYYGSASGNYFGEGANQGGSPIDVRKQNSITIDNLKNGVLYYFSVSAYDNSGLTGDYSKEVSARPLRMIE
jgi:hypothetical protein